MEKLPKISAIMCTYGRFTCVTNATNMFLQQDGRGEVFDSELIIFNTDAEHPYEQTQELTDLGIRIFNNNIDYLTGEPYTNVGAVRRDSLTHATGGYYICWDDDDSYMPWFMIQSIDRMKETGLPSFKPAESFFKSHEVCMVRNTLEASICSDINVIRKYGFNLNTALEGLAWYTRMRDSGELVENDYHMIPHYCFNWGDSVKTKSGHKQSGSPDNPQNFQNHKQASTDYCTGPIEIFTREYVVKELYQEYYDFIKENKARFHAELLEKYCSWINE